MNIGTIIYTWFFGQKVGVDEFKNIYYCNSKNFEDLNSKRWVLFSGEIEASKIPAHWHAWLHKTIDIPPINYKKKHVWQKNHEQNLTGTNQAHNPIFNNLSKEEPKSKKDYETWNP